MINDGKENIEKDTVFFIINMKLNMHKGLKSEDREGVKS